MKKKVKGYIQIINPPKPNRKFSEAQKKKIKEIFSKHNIKMASKNSNIYKEGPKIFFTNQYKKEDKNG